MTAEEILKEQYGPDVKVMARRGNEYEWVQAEKPDVKVYREPDRDKDGQIIKLYPVRYYRLPAWVKRPI